MLTIRPPPAGRMAVNAARQHRNEPVRLTPSVRSHVASVVSANGTEASTAAAQTSAVGPPAAPAAGGEHDMGAGRGDGHRGGGPDPPAGPRDHRHPPGQPVPPVRHWPAPS